MKKFVVFDTTSIVSFFENGFSIPEDKAFLTPPEEIQGLLDLLKALDDDKIKIIISEVVIQESDRNLKERNNDLKEIFDKALNSFKSIQDSNKKISKRLIDKIENELKKIIESEEHDNQKAWDIFNKIIAHRNTRIAKITENVLMNAFKRGLSGKKPFKTHYSLNDAGKRKMVSDIQSDCVMVESVKDELKNEDTYEIVLVTNDADYYSTSGKNEIDEQIKKELKVSSTYISIPLMLNKEFKMKLPDKNIEEDEDIGGYLVSPNEIPVGGNDSTSISGGEKQINL